MQYLLIVFILGALVWIAGLVVAAYHVFKYRTPGDITVTAFWIFFGVSAITFITVISYLTSLEWS